VEAQVPSIQACSGPQRVPHAPQLALSLRSDTQDPSQLVASGGQLPEHCPFTHVCPLGQASLQAPQL
jgi:hypothetical protein